MQALEALFCLGYKANKQPKDAFQVKKKGIKYVNYKEQIHLSLSFYTWTEMLRAICQNRMHHNKGHFVYL